uniref:Amidohydrolase 3 domain-containing protein n=1 Tax=Streptomyces avermitilis TaxID=33903 RepID=A0A499VQG2_STRAX|nr:hypothetical protein SAVMC3_78490 [Streptomyces avermitilis]
MSESTAPSDTVLLRGGEVHSPADPFATAMVVERGQVAWVGSEGAADAFSAGVDEVVDLEGALVTPAFTDAHVHTTSTGLALTGLDLSGAPSLEAALALVRDFAAARPDDRVLLGHGWDTARWPGGRPPTRAELDEAADGRPLYLSRIDVHSAVVSTALLDLVPGITGRAGYLDGPLTRDAHHAVRGAALGAVSPAQRTEAQRAALAHAASLGIGSVHECAGPEISSEDDFTGLLRLAAEETGPRVVGYWAEWGEEGIDRARALGAVGAAGDLFVDGALGSHTACLHQPYSDAGHTGTAYLDDDAVAAHVIACTEAGLQAGFHAIGDAAVTSVVEGVRAAAEKVGLARVRAARHRVEHAEMLTPRPSRPSRNSASPPPCSPPSTRCGAARTACTRSAWAPSGPVRSTPSPPSCGPAYPLPSAPTVPSPRSTRGAPSARRPSTARRSTVSPCAPRSRRIRVADGGRSDGTTRGSWCRARPPTMPCGAPRNWSCRPPTTASPAGPPTRARAPRDCPT